MIRGISFDRGSECFPSHPWDCRWESELTESRWFQGSNNKEWAPGRQIPAWGKEEKKRKYNTFFSGRRSNTVCYCRALGTYKIPRCQMGSRYQLSLRVLGEMSQTPSFQKHSRHQPWVLCVPYRLLFSKPPLLLRLPCTFPGTQLGPASVSPRSRPSRIQFPAHVLIKAFLQSQILSWEEIWHELLR